MAPIVEEAGTRTPSQMQANSQWTLTKEQFETKLKTVKIDPRSLRLFKVSNENVAFVGAYNIKTNTLYLHPLVPWKQHYSTNDFNPSSWGTFSEKFQDWQMGLTKEFVEPIEHRKGINQYGDAITSHAHILHKYGFKHLGIQNNWNDFIGFSLTKKIASPAGHVFNGQSQSLHGYSDGKFHDAAHPMSSRKFFSTNPDTQDYYLPMEWCDFLMKALENILNRNE